MKRDIILLFCIELLMYMPGLFIPAFAQDKPVDRHNLALNNGIEEMEMEFNKAVIRHAVELKNLMDEKTKNPFELYYPKNKIDSVTAQTIINTLRNSYSDSTALLFYNYEDTTTLKIWLLNRHGIMSYCKKVIDQSKLTKEINALRKALRIDSLQDKSRAPSFHEGTNKSSTLRSVIKIDKDPITRIDLPVAIDTLTSILLPHPLSIYLAAVNALIIVPVLDLGTVPFAILRPSKTDSSLIDRMSISVASSLFDIIVDKSEKWSPVFHNALIVGNPNFTNRENWRFPNLKGAEKEANHISKHIKSSKLLIGKKATKSAVLAYVEEADLLYFATHGVSATQESRTNSFIVLGATASDNGFWTMKEILDKRYKARLAVLSACQTGLGETYKGGIMALGRTFQVAGVPQVAMSLWQVDDDATDYLMESFVANLFTYIPSEALRHAMLETREIFKDPAKWASFVLFGIPK